MKNTTTKVFHSWDDSGMEFFDTVLKRTVSNRDRVRILGHNSKRRRVLGEDVRYRVDKKGFHWGHKDRPRFHIVLEMERYPMW